jgi:hypothetical protein
MPDTFLLCRECGTVHRLYSVQELAEGGMVSEAAAIAYGGFLVDHRHHPLERLERTATPVYHAGPLWSPHQVSITEVTNGRDTLTVRSARESVDDGRTGTIVPERLLEGRVQIGIDEPHVRRALDHHFHPYALRPSKIDRFVDAVHDVLAQLPAEHVVTEFDDADDPAVSIGRLPDEGVVALLDRGIEIFDAWELARIASFVSAERDEYGALALQVRRQMLLR